MTLDYIWLTADEPRIAQAYAVRIAVFIQEQHVPLDDEIDHREGAADHLVALTDGKGVGCLRMLFHDNTAKIGRVAVLPAWRGQGLGLELMRRAMARASERGCTTITLDAQTHAIPFYERLGFTAQGDPFLDAGIPHRTMTHAIR